MSSDEDLDHLPAPRSRAVMAILGMAMLSGSMMMGGFGGRSAYAERHDPNRHKTPEDLENMERARVRREKRAAKRAAKKSP